MLNELRYHPAYVLDVDDTAVRTNLMLRTGAQRLRVELLRGPERGKVVLADNFLTGQLGLDETYKQGDKLLLQYSIGERGELSGAVARGYYRISGELLLVGLFVLLLVLVAGVTGLKALLSFAFTVIVIWRIMIPLFLAGKNPLIVGVLASLLMAAIVSFLVGGINRRGLVAFLGSLLGLALTCLLAVLFTDVLRIHGAVLPFSETLLYSGYYELKLTPIFIASVIIGCSGAMTDLSMDIASAMAEIRQRSPRTGGWQLIRSGMSVGRAVVGTMTTTLLLAYFSSYITMFMLFASQGMNIVQMVNINYVAAEILNVLVGSLGLITVAPFTALIGGFIWRSNTASDNPD